MSLNHRRLGLAALALALGGCAITQNVQPVAALDGPQVCIIQNPAVRPGFLDTYLRVMGERGYQVRQLPAGAALTDCEVVSTYTGRWSWDLALYMAYAEITVYRNGQQAGQAVYDARQGSGLLSKYIKGEEKIAELVTRLFPVRARS
jgi:hypothetical protein